MQLITGGPKCLGMKCADTGLSASWQGAVRTSKVSRLRLKCDGTRAETRFSRSGKRTSPFKSAGASVQSTIGSLGLRISLQGLYCSCKPVFCSHVTLAGYPLHSLVSPSSPPVRHRVPSDFIWTLPSSTAEVKNLWSFTTISLLSYTLFRNVYRDTANHKNC